MFKKEYPQFVSKKDEYILVQSFGFKKKVAKIFVCSTKNVAKKLINSLIYR